MNKRQILITVCCGMIVAGVVLGAGNIIQNITNYYEAPADQQGNENLGASASTLNYWTDQNGIVTYVVGGYWDSSYTASTTFISALNPIYNATNTDWTNAGNLSYLKSNVWSGTSTVDLISLASNGTNTSSVSVYCGASANPFEKGTYLLIDNVEVSDTSRGFPTSTIALMESNSSSTLGLSVIPTGSKESVQLTRDYPFITCVATSTADNWAEYGLDAIIGSSSLFDGTYKIRARYTPRY